jgi:hypothetical protein
MIKLKLTGFDELEIKNVSGKTISFKKIEIPNENCSDFHVRYKVSNQNDLSTNSGTIICSVSPYQRDATWAPLNKSFSLPDNCILNVQLESTIRQSFKGVAFVDYEIFDYVDETKRQPDKRIFISERDRENAFRIALKNLGQFFKIENWEYDDNQTLYNKLKELNDPIVKLLQNYFKAYNEWFKFYEKIKEIETIKGQAYNLSENEKAELAELIKARQNTLDALQEKFDELQLKRFNNIHGLGNIDGIIL